MHVIFIVEGLHWFQDEEQQRWGFSLLILYGFVSCAFNTHLFFFKDGNALYDVHMHIELSIIFRNIQIFLVFISMFNISGKYFFLNIYEKGNCQNVKASIFVKEPLKFSKKIMEIKRNCILFCAVLWELTLLLIFVVCIWG